MTTTDQILIKDLELEARVGAFSAEREIFQRLVIDLRLGIDLRRAGETAELADTVCYLTLSERIREFVAGRIWVLVEEVAAAVCGLIFEFDPRIESIKIGVRKFVVPGAQYAGVEIERRRNP